MATERTMSTTWRGTLMDGSGTIHEAGSGAFGPLDVTWASRAEEPDGKTSPEELIAAAHSACFSMALSHALAQAGTPADQLDTSATVTFVAGQGITKIALTVRGSVPGIDEAAFAAAAEARRRLPGLEGARRRPRDHAGATLVPAARPVAAAGSTHQTLVAGIEPLVEELERSYADLQARLSDPAVYNDHREAAEVGRRLKELEAPHKLARRVAGRARRPRRRAGRPGARRARPPSSRTRSSGSRRSSSSRSSSATPPTRRT